MYKIRMLKGRMGDRDMPTLAQKGNKVIVGVVVVLC